MDDVGFYSSAEVEGLRKLSPRRRRQIAAGRFPPGLLLGWRTRVWPRAEIHAWVEIQIKQAREHNDLEQAAELRGARMVEARRIRADQQIDAAAAEKS